MNLLSTFRQSQTEDTAATPRSLDQLFAEAETLGRLSVSRMSDEPGKRPRYWARIKFFTVAGTSLEADGNIVEGPHEAIEQALENARKIREQFK